MYYQPVLLEEIFDLEFDEQKGQEGKVDHPVNGSKDVYDAVVGAYTTLLTRSASWAMPFGEAGMLESREDARYDDDERFGADDRV
jgi:hypothetical protein